MRILIDALHPSELLARSIPPDQAKQVNRRLRQLNLFFVGEHKTICKGLPPLPIAPFGISELGSNFTSITQRPEMAWTKPCISAEPASRFAAEPADAEILRVARRNRLWHRIENSRRGNEWAHHQGKEEGEHGIST
jgi:hypothetical protein